MTTPTAQEALLWHQLAHAKLKPAERMSVLRAAKALDGEVADLEKWVEAGLPGVPAPVSTAFEAVLQGNVTESFLLEELSEQGIKLLTGRDEDYPRRFKRAFLEKTPVALYAVGNTGLLGATRTVAIVGSRDAGQDAVKLAQRAAAYFAREGYVLVSGNARGIDQTAEEAALQAAGKVISVLPQGLLDKASAALIRKHSRALLDGQHLLLSELHPKARWQARFAMMRNRLIMAQADAVLVAQTGAKEGVVNGKKVQSGTWAGAQEAVKLGKPVFVFDLPYEGNQLLAQELAQKISPTEDEAMFFELENLLGAHLAAQRAKPLTSGGRKRFSEQPSLFS